MTYSTENIMSNLAGRLKIGCVSEFQPLFLSDITWNSALLLENLERWLQCEWSRKSHQSFFFNGLF